MRVGNTPLATNVANLSEKRSKELRGQDAHQTLQKRKESDLDHPHMLERHSGTGKQAYGYFIESYVSHNQH